MELVEDLASVDRGSALGYITFPDDVKSTARAAPRRTQTCDRIMRVADIVLAVTALIALGPLLLLIWIMVRFTSKGPGLFAHQRVGRHGASFPCFKFRTMVVDAEARLVALLAADPSLRMVWEREHKFPKDPRITSIGVFLRKSSLDELPQLFNVLRGEMSLVGPRPITSSEIVRYGRHFHSYSAVRPGITGLWQVNGRSSVSYRRRVALDSAYVRRRSVKLYARIIVGTIPAVLLQKGSC